MDHAYPILRTSGENIGDSGIIQAYRAWKAQFNDSFKAGNEYLLPGLNYTRCDIADLVLCISSYIYICAETNFSSLPLVVFGQKTSNLRLWSKVRLSIDDPTEYPSYQLFSSILPQRNDAFSGRNPRRI